MPWDKLASGRVTITPFGQIPTGGYELVAQAGSFDELNQKLAGTGRSLSKGDKVRFWLQLKEPVAPAFNLAGAELIFKPIMPKGLILDDVRGEGWTTVIIEAHATSPQLAAIGAWLAANWVWVTLGAIGIAVALGVLVASAAFLVLAIHAPEAIPQTAMWIALGLGGLAAVGLVAYGVRKKRAM